MKYLNNQLIIEVKKETYTRLDKKEKKRYRKQIKGEITKNFKSKSDKIVERLLKIDSIGAAKKGGFADLLNEACMLYSEGHFYSVVALTGVVAENICIQLIDESRIYINGKFLKSEQKKALKTIGFAGLNRLLLNSKIIGQKSYEKLEDIRDKRNKYIHNDPKIDPQKDSLEVLNNLIYIVKKEFHPMKR